MTFDGNDSLDQVWNIPSDTLWLWAAESIRRHAWNEAEEFVAELKLRGAINHWHFGRLNESQRATLCRWLCPGVGWDLRVIQFLGGDEGVPWRTEGF